MRVWCGIDREHGEAYGSMTLFVESDNPDIDKLVAILSSCSSDIQYIYFGAGEVDIHNWKFLNQLHKLCGKYIIGIETSTELSEDIIGYFDFVIFRLPIPIVSDRIYMKYRTPDTVGIANMKFFAKNSLSDLSNGQYSNDVELYRED